jgi:hypothetical protein
MVLAASLVPAWLVSGCASSGGRAAGAYETPVAPDTQPAPARWDVPAGAYPRAFDAARDVLRDMNFMLERVDAQAGVIATQQKGTAGIVTPWDREQSTLGQEVEDTLQRQKRAVRVEFVPAGGGGGGADAGADLSVDDLRRLAQAGTGVQMRVSVDVYRWHQPGWRLNTQAILYSTYTRDPQAEARGMTFYGVATGRDDALAERIASEIRRRTGDQPPVEPG